MRQLLGIIFLYVCMTTTLYAAETMTCLHPEKVRALSLSGWQAFEDESDRKLTRAEVKPVAQAAYRFVLAAWTGKDGRRHVSCFYQDKKHRHLGFYLKKINVTPVRHHQRWYETGLQAEDLHCSGSAEHCQFV